MKFWKIFSICAIVIGVLLVGIISYTTYKDVQTFAGAENITTVTESTPQVAETGTATAGKSGTGIWSWVIGLGVLVVLGIGLYFIGLPSLMKFSKKWKWWLVGIAVIATIYFSSGKTGVNVLDIIIGLAITVAVGFALLALGLSFLKKKSGSPTRVPGTPPPVPSWLNEAKKKLWSKQREFILLLIIWGICLLMIRSLFPTFWGLWLGHWALFGWTQIAIGMTFVIWAVEPEKLHISWIYWSVMIVAYFAALMIELRKLPEPNRVAKGSAAVIVSTNGSEKITIIAPVEGETAEIEIPRGKYIRTERKGSVIAWKNGMLLVEPGTKTNHVIVPDDYRLMVGDDCQKIKFRSMNGWPVEISYWFVDSAEK